MSCIHLHLGQAGNQIGKSFWGLAEEEYLTWDDGAATRGGSGPAVRMRKAGKQPSRLRPGGAGMFHEDRFARCLAVDSEPKVVQNFQGQVQSLRPENVLFSQSGLANNWAMGFASCRENGEGTVGSSGHCGDGGLFARCMESMRREAERCCWLNSVVMNHSLAGGTGSGLGSGLLQALRDEYPSLYLISVCVGAFGAGEAPLQHYNSAFALHHLQAFADAVIYRGNDDLLQTARVTPAPESRRTSSSSGIGPGSRAGLMSQTRPQFLRGIGRGDGGVVSTADMNHTLALDMSSYFFPTTKLLPSAIAQEYLCHNSLSAARDRHALRRGRADGCKSSRPLSLRQPADPYGNRVAYAPRNFDGGSLMAAACPLPAAKFVDLRSTLSSAPPVRDQKGGGGGISASALESLLSSRKSSDWAGFAASLGKTSPLCPGKGGGQSGDVCVAAHHVLRGVDKAYSGRTAEESVDFRGKCLGTAGGKRGSDRAADMMKGSHDVGMSVAAAAAALDAGTALRAHHGCAEWRTATDVSYSPAFRQMGVARSVTTVCNQTRIRGVLHDVVARAEEKFRARAYLHWYYRHGLEDEDFLAAFEGVRDVERGYDDLAGALGSVGGVDSTGYGNRRR